MAKLTKKSYRRKRMLMGLALFMSIALISTGFAAWVISSSVEKNEEGNVSVGVISDKSIGLSVEVLDVNGDNKSDEADLNIKFEPNKKDSSGRVRYDGVETFDEEKQEYKYSSSNYESLKVSLKLTVTDPSGYLAKLTIQFSELRAQLQEGQEVFSVVPLKDSYLYAAADKYDENGELITEGFIRTPKCFNEVVDLKDSLKVEDQKAGISTVIYDIEFGWGAKFYGINPGYFYDGKDNLGNDQTDKSILEAGTNLINDKTVVDNLVDLRKTIYGITTGEKVLDETTKEYHYLPTYYNEDITYVEASAPKYRIVIKADAN